MAYFSIVKSDKNNLVDKNIKLIGGYKFSQKINITLYNKEITKYILLQKLNNYLKNIINLIILLDEDNSDEESTNVIKAKLETLRKLLLEKYSIYIGIKETETYLKRIEKLETKVSSRKEKKSMRR